MSKVFKISSVMIVVLLFLTISVSCGNKSTPTPTPTPTSKPTLTMLSPKEGDSVLANTVISLTWSAAGLPTGGTFNIFYHINGEDNPFWIQLPDNPAVNTTHTDFAVPDKPGQNLSISIGLWDWPNSQWIVSVGVNNLKITGE
jgi:hypothetical protein